MAKKRMAKKTGKDSTKAKIIRRRYKQTTIFHVIATDALRMLDVTRRIMNRAAGESDDNELVDCNILMKMFREKALKMIDDGTKGLPGDAELFSSQVQRVHNVLSLELENEFDAFCGALESGDTVVQSKAQETMMNASAIIKEDRSSNNKNLTVEKPSSVAEPSSSRYVQRTEDVTQDLSSQRSPKPHSLGKRVSGGHIARKKTEHVAGRGRAEFVDVEATGSDHSSSDTNTDISTNTEDSLKDFIVYDEDD
ncbi:hypothetical protein G7Y79_00006g018970 [Physcia stellaris]|nr:hypothetical protein G7Y79_00006g018970 [Physcia stellaris]